MLTIIWLDPETDDADEPAWAVWVTECGEYRIYYDAASDTYAPRRLVATEGRAANITDRTWVDVAAAQPDLDAAMDEINQYHCREHRLVLA